MPHCCTGSLSYREQNTFEGWLTGRKIFLTGGCGIFCGCRSAQVVRDFRASRSIQSLTSFVTAAHRPRPATVPQRLGTAASGFPCRQGNSRLLPAQPTARKLESSACAQKIMESASLAMELQDCQKRCTVFVTPDTKKIHKSKKLQKP